MHLLETAIALSLQANLPRLFWDECVLCATFLINRTPLKSIADQTPYFRMYRTFAPLNHLSIFGCLVYSFTCKVNRMQSQ